MQSECEGMVPGAAQCQMCLKLSAHSPLFTSLAQRRHHALLHKSDLVPTPFPLCFPSEFKRPTKRETQNDSYYADNTTSTEPSSDSAHSENPEDDVVLISEPPSKKSTESEPGKHGSTGCNRSVLDLGSDDHCSNLDGRPDMSIASLRPQPSQPAVSRGETKTVEIGKSTDDGERSQWGWTTDTPQMRLLRSEVSILVNMLRARICTDFPCRKCGYKIKVNTKGGLHFILQHVMKHNPKILEECAICGFKTKSTLYSHFKKAHPDVAKVEKIDYRPKHARSLTIIVRECYPAVMDAKLILLSWGTEGGAFPRSLLEHLETLVGKWVTCSACGERADSRGTWPLLLHLLSEQKDVWAL